MWIEAFLISGNLGSFLMGIFLLLFPSRIRFFEKILFWTLFLLFSFVFYLSFWGKMGDEKEFFQWKALIFGNSYLAFSVIISVALSYAFKEQKKWAFFFPVLFLGPILFFLFFGLEILHFFSWEISSFSFQKAQNPILISAFLIVLFIPHPHLARGVSFAILVGLISFSISEKNSLEKKMKLEFIHSRYIPHEFFLEGNAFLLEETYGVYTFFRKVEIEEPIYKFSLKPIRWLERKDRQTVQNLVDRLEFPIVIKEDKKITVYEMCRSFRGETFQAVYDIESGKMKMVGPIF